MKNVSDFRNFLSDTVNLNQTRLGHLKTRVITIKNFIRDSDWEPQISTFVEHGSWAHDTDLPLIGPPLITIVCRFGFDSCGFRIGHAR